MAIEPKDVLDFWFSPRMRENWFSKSDEIDAEIREKFLTAYEDARADKLEQWKQQPESALALTILLISFRAICFAALPAHSKAMGWPVMWPHRRSTMISTGSYRLTSASSSICPSCIANI